MRRDVYRVDLSDLRDDRPRASNFLPTGEEMPKDETEPKTNEQTNKPCNATLEKNSRKARRF
jgi:hypothetical protein